MPLNALRSSCSDRNGALESRVQDQNQPSNPEPGHPAVAQRASSSTGWPHRFTSSNWHSKASASFFPKSVW